MIMMSIVAVVNYLVIFLMMKFLSAWESIAVRSPGEVRYIPGETMDSN